MRLGFAAAFAIALPLLAACSNDQPPAKPAAEAPAVTKPAVTTPAAPATATVPAGAAPLLGTWAPTLAACSDQQAVTVITATTYAAPSGSCDISLAPGKDGSFTTACGSSQLTLTPVFAPTGEGVNVVVGEGERQTVLRCTR
jgi:streptogramin lyase